MSTSYPKAYSVDIFLMDTVTLVILCVVGLFKAVGKLLDLVFK